VFVSVQQPARAQQSNLALELFGRYLEQLRVESGIPGLSAAIIQNGSVVWASGFGMADVERSIRTEVNTPFVVADLTETFSSALVLQALDRGYDFELDDSIKRWTSTIPESNATVRSVLMHTTTGPFRFDPSRYAALTPLIEYYNGRKPFRKAVADQILERFGMLDSVPGHDIESAASERALFDQDDLNRYGNAIARLALPYRIDSRTGRPTRSEFPPRTIDASSGLISTVLDLARFDAALDDPGAVVSEESQTAMWAPAGLVNGTRIPTGLGWFVQTYNGERLVWHFGLAPDAYSSLILKVPGRDLTLILLANSDRLSAPYALNQGDVTTSLFARTFLNLFLR